MQEVFDEMINRSLLLVHAVLTLSWLGAAAQEHGGGRAPVLPSLSSTSSFRVQSFWVDRHFEDDEASRRPDTYRRQVHQYIPFRVDVNSKSYSPPDCMGLYVCADSDNL